MATVLQPDDGSIGEVIADVVARFHEQLSEVKIGALRAYATGRGSVHAIQINGYPCLAAVRIVGYAERVLGLPDALITVDGATWERLGPEIRTSLIDHEVTHLEWKVGKKGLCRDDLGRPRLLLRRHDHQFGWFDDVVRRHGSESCEAKQLASFLAGTVKQQWLPSLGDETPAASESAPDNADDDVAIAEKLVRRMMRATR